MTNTSGKLVSFYGKAGIGKTRRMVDEAYDYKGHLGKVIHICSDNSPEYIGNLYEKRAVNGGKSMSDITLYQFSPKTFTKATLITYLESLGADENTVIAIDNVKHLCDSELSSVLFALKAFAKRTGVAVYVEVQSPPDGKLIIETIIPDSNVNLGKSA